MSCACGPVNDESEQTGGSATIVNPNVPFSHQTIGEPDRSERETDPATVGTDPRTLEPAKRGPEHSVGTGHASSVTINLSQRKLTEAERRLLDRGLTFVPRYFRYPEHLAYALQNRLVRSLKLNDYYADLANDGNFDPKVKTFKRPSQWTPSDGKISDETRSTVQEIVTSTENLIAGRMGENCNYIRLSRRSDNLLPDERQALRVLKSDRSIVIKPADKGSATVVMDRDAYLAEGYRQLNNSRYYRKLSEPLLTANVARINDILLSMRNDGSITTAQWSYLRASESDRHRRFYMLPKIHKPPEKWPQPGTMPEGRPIVSDSASESVRVAEFIDSYLRPISTVHAAYLKDTYDFVGRIRGKAVPSNAFLVTGDVTSLYTNMTHDRIMTVTKEALRRRPRMGRPDQHLLDLLDFTLRSNDFEFNGQTYLQICGTAMGKSYAPSLADLYLEEFDSRAHQYHTVPVLYLRFLDDVFFIWTGSEEQLVQFGVYLNGLIDGITVTLSWSQHSVDFLDTTVYKHPLPGEANTVELRTRVFFKPTDTHQLLHKRSFHPRHTCLGVLKSQMLRFKRIASSRDDYDLACRTLSRALTSRGYSQRLMRKVKAEVWRLSTAPKAASVNRVLPVIVPYNDLGCNMARSWRDIIARNHVFDSLRPITAYTIGPNLGKLLVHSLVDPATSDRKTKQTQTFQPSGCYHCTSLKCKVCFHLVEGTHFASRANGKRFPVRGKISCKTANLVYLITCRKCSLQYVGETARPLADRTNDHKSAIRLRKNTPIGLHFGLPGHRMTDFMIMGIESFSPASTADQRKTKEIAWQNLLQTSYPGGLNNLRPSHLNVK